MFPRRSTFTGQATVLAVSPDGIQIQFDLGPDDGSLTVIARAGNSPIPVALGETVRIAYQARRNPRVPHEVIAIQTSKGYGIAQVTEGATGPATANVPFFGVTARQIGDQPPPLVEIGVGGGVKPQNLRVDDTRKVGDVFVRVVSSTAPPKGVDAGLFEGSPYVVNVLVWKVP